MKNSHLLAAAKLQANHLINEKDDKYHHYTIQNASKSQGQDFTDLWNQISDDDIQSQQDKSIQSEKQQFESKVNQSNQNIPIEKQKINSVSSFGKQQMAEWLEECQDSDKQDFDITNHNNSLDNQTKSIKPQNHQRSESQSEVSGLDELWDMIQDSGKQQVNPNTILIEPQKTTNNIFSYQDQNQVKMSEEKLSSINTIKERYQTETFNKKESIKQISPLYTEFNGFETLYVQSVEAEIKAQQQGSSEIFEPEDILTKNCQLIIQQIEQQSKEENSYRNYTSQILIYGTDFCVFDLTYFAKNNLKPSTHMYFGFKSVLDKKRTKNQYLYFPNNGECLLKTKYKRQSDKKKENNHQQLSIHLVPNDEKVASAQKTVFESNKEKREIYEIKNYDSFTNENRQYLGIIETKAGKIFESWFCDTVIFIPKKKIFSKKINNNDWEKLKISLKTKNGMILAELGIEVADNSVINCVLFNEQKNRQFMMGMIEQLEIETDYVLRVGGISPIIGMMTAISRKQFAYPNV